MNGWLKLHRKIREWEWYSSPSTKAVFLHCILSANWRERNWSGIRIPRGAFFTSDESLCRELGLSRQEVRTSLNRLKSTNEITIKSTNRGKLVTLCNFELYNGDDDESNQPENQQVNNQPTNDQPTINQRSTTTEESKKEKKGRTKNKTANANSVLSLSIPDDLPEEVRGALTDWKRHRSEIRKRITETQWERLIVDCRTSPSVMVAAIHRSVVSGWQGLFPESPSKAPHAQSRKQTINDYDNPANWTEDQFSLNPQTA